MTGPEGFPQDADEARLDLELTRRELGETAEALANKVKDTAQTTERAVLTTGVAIGVVLLVVLLLRRLIGGR